MITDCQNEREKRKKSVELTFLRSELLYDIRNNAYVEGDLTPAEAEHNRHQTIDVGEKGNIDIVTRTLNLAYTEVLDMLYPFTRKDVECGTTKDDVLKEPFDYVVEMRVPEEFSQTTADYLETLIHEYMVLRVLSDWIGITRADRQPYWMARLEGIRERIEACKNMRTGRVRRTLSPW